MISAFDYGYGYTPYGSFWTSVASAFKTAGQAVGTGAQTVGKGLKTGAQATAKTWQSLDPQTQAFLLESGQTAVAQALAARQQRLAEQQLAVQQQQQAQLALAAQPSATSGSASWLLPVAVLGGFGLVAVALMSGRRGRGSRG